MLTTDFRVCDLHTQQSFFYLDALGGATFNYIQGSAILGLGRGQDIETPCIHTGVLFMLCFEEFGQQGIQLILCTFQVLGSLSGDFHSLNCGCS